jgi:GTPase Era involved in 16S rRNA processing
MAINYEKIKYAKKFVILLKEIKNLNALLQDEIHEYKKFYEENFTETQRETIEYLESISEEVTNLNIEEL